MNAKEIRKIAIKLHRQGHTIHTAGHYPLPVLRALDTIKWNSLKRIK